MTESALDPTQTMELSTNFYEAIPVFYRISGISNSENYHDVPEDWLIAISDVRNSTGAIERGQYRDVNAVAAAMITAILNHIPQIDVPFVFGGDGATMLIPPQIEQQTRESLLATQRMAMDAFGLELRVGIIPVSDVLKDGYWVRVARMEVSDNYHQAMFTGGGLAHADSLLKHPLHGARYTVRPDPLAGAYQADFSGFECRWTELRSASEETMSLMVMVTDADVSRHAELYAEIITRLEQIYGDKSLRNPLRIRNMRMSTLPGAFKREAKIKGNAGWRALLRLAKNTMMARIAMHLNIQGWGQYKKLFVEASDHEKFDDTLRMIVTGTPKQRAELRAYLETRRKVGQLVYGTHVSNRVLVTCVIFDHFGRQVHFVDGSNGGYAMAAKEMKAQIRAK